MTEDEYIKVSALNSIVTVSNVLKDIIPESIEGIISNDEYKQVMSTIWNWKTRLFDSIETQPDEE